MAALNDESFKIIKSNRGGETLLFECFKFRKFRIQKKHVVWRCSLEKNCTAWVKTDVAVSKILEVHNEHRPPHEPLDDKTIEVQEIRTAVKRKAVENLNQQPSKIIREEVKAKNSVTYADVPALRQAGLRARSKFVSRKPRNRDEAMKQIAELMLSTNDTENIIVTDPIHEIVGVSCEENVKFLSDYSDVILSDGTFAYAPKHFSQTYTIHVYHDGFYVHVFTFFLPSKEAVTYAAMWRLLKEVCEKKTKKEFNIKLLMVDFESAVLKAARDVFPSAIIKGCRFHLGQSFFRKIQSMKKLRNCYLRNDTTDPAATEIKKWLQMFFSLSYLPPEKIQDAFVELFSIAPAISEATKFADYILNNYITTEQYPPEMWASPLTEANCTTTNGVESYSAKLGGEFYFYHPNIHVAIEQIFDAQSLVDLKVRSVRSGEKCKKRPQIQKLHDNITDVTYFYLSGRLNTLDFLRDVVDLKHKKPTESDANDAAFVDSDKEN